MTLEQQFSKCDHRAAASGRNLLECKFWTPTPTPAKPTESESLRVEPYSFNKASLILCGACLRPSALGIGEGNGTPFQYSCLDNPMDGGAWWAAVHEVAKSQTRLSNFTFTFMHWRRKWQSIPVFLPGESQGRGSMVGCRLCDRTESDTTEVTQQQQQQHRHTQAHIFFKWDQLFEFFFLTQRLCHDHPYFFFQGIFLTQGDHIGRQTIPSEPPGKPRRQNTDTIKC